MKQTDFLSGEKRGINYRIYYPNEYQENLPCIVYLHGAGERGKNIDHLTRHGLAKLLGEGLELNAVVICPQCPADSVWDNVVHPLKDLIDEIVVKYCVDTDRITVTGSSMGGFGTWMLGMTYPNDFAGIAPVASGGMEWRAAKLRTTPVRAYHGRLDPSVSYIRTEMMVERVNACGGHAEAIYFETLGHNDAIDFAYRNTDLLDWLLCQKRNKEFTVSEICSELF